MNNRETLKSIQKKKDTLYIEEKIRMIADFAMENNAIEQTVEYF